MTTPETNVATTLAKSRTSLAAKRNLMAADRTLMAWIRTALSMISFGFTIYKLLEAFQKEGAALPQAHTPRNFGLFLTGLGTLSMIMGTISYLHSLRELRQIEPIRTWQPSLVMALVMCGMGLFLFFGIISRIL